MRYLCGGYTSVLDEEKEHYSDRDSQLTHKGKYYSCIWHLFDFSHLFILEMSEPVVSNRRRRDNKDPKETPGGAAAAGDAPERTRERKVSSDIPAEMVGTTATGVISALSKSSMKSKFGFIQTADKLIIYFNFDSYTDEEFAKPKKGVEVN